MKIIDLFLTLNFLNINLNDVRRIASQDKNILTSIELKDLLDFQGVGKASLEKIKNSVNDVKKQDKIKYFLDEQKELAIKNNVRIVTYFDDNYFHLLKTSIWNPVLLFVKGDLGQYINLKDNYIAIIGTRKSQPLTTKINQKITRFLCNDFVVVSGLALGHDSIAHQETLLNKGKTIAVMPCGLDNIYPYQNKHLFQKIIDNNGLAISQFPFSSNIEPKNFVMRDFIQAGLSKAVIMVESNLKGGSLHASRASLKDGRWLIIPRMNVDKIKKPFNFDNIAVNEVICKASEKEIKSLLNCNDEDLKRIFKLNNTDESFNEMKELLLK